MKTLVVAAAIRFPSGKVIERCTHVDCYYEAADMGVLNPEIPSSKMVLEYAEIHGFDGLCEKWKITDGFTVNKVFLSRRTALNLFRKQGFRGRFIGSEDIDANGCLINSA